MSGSGSTFIIYVDNNRKEIVKRIKKENKNITVL